MKVWPCRCTCVARNGDVCSGIDKLLLLDELLREVAVTDGVISCPNCHELPRPAILSYFNNSTREHRIDILISCRKVYAIMQDSFAVDWMQTHTKPRTDMDILQGEGNQRHQILIIHWGIYGLTVPFNTRSPGFRNGVSYYDAIRQSIM